MFFSSKNIPSQRLQITPTFFLYHFYISQFYFLSSPLLSLHILSPSSFPLFFPSFLKFFYNFLHPLYILFYFLIFIFFPLSLSHFCPSSILLFFISSDSFLLFSFSALLIFPTFSSHPFLPPYFSLLYLFISPPPIHGKASDLPALP